MTVIRLEDPHVAVLIDSLLITREKIEGEGRTAPTLREASNKICDLVDPATDGLYVSTGDPKVLTHGIRRALLDLVGTVDPENVTADDLKETISSRAWILAIARDLRRALVEFEVGRD